MSKQNWLDVAEVIDAHRVIPKLFVLAAGIGYVWFAVDSYGWVKEIFAEKGVIPTEVAAYAGATLGALGTLLMLVLNKYFDGGRNWSKEK